MMSGGESVLIRTLEIEVPIVRATKIELPLFRAA